MKFIVSIGQGCQSHLWFPSPTLLTTISKPNATVD
jgi:hypothetical protein